MIAATLPAVAAAANEWDFLIVGAGPAGAAAALRMARLGRRVLLVDRSPFPRPKVCGCCLSPAAMRELAALDLRVGHLPEGVPLTAVRLAVAGRDARIAMSGGATVSREALDAALVRAAIDSGVEWIPGLTVTAIDAHDSGAVATVRAASGGTCTLRAGVVVIAAGLADAIRIGHDAASHVWTGGRRSRRVAPTSLIGLGTTLPPDAGDLPAGELVMAVGERGYTGIVRLEDGRLDLAAAVAPGAVMAAGSPAATIAAILAQAGAAARTCVATDALRGVGIRATPPLTHSTRLTEGVRGTVLRIGDAAVYVEPFTGEGIGWALASARLLAVAAAVTHDAARLAARYRDAHARLFSSRHARCRGVARVVRHPPLLAGAVRLASFAPGTAARAVPWLVGGGGLP